MLNPTASPQTSTTPPRSLPPETPLWAQQHAIPGDGSPRRLNTFHQLRPGVPTGSPYPQSTSSKSPGRHHLQLDPRRRTNHLARKVIVAPASVSSTTPQPSTNPYLGSLVSTPTTWKTSTASRAKKSSSSEEAPQPSDSAAALIRPGRRQLVARRTTSASTTTPPEHPAAYSSACVRPTLPWPGWRSLLSSDAPQLFHRLPYDLRTTS